MNAIDRVMTNYAYGDVWNELDRRKLVEEAAKEMSSLIKAAKAVRMWYDGKSLSEDENEALVEAAEALDESGVLDKKGAANG